MGTNAPRDFYGSLKFVDLPAPPSVLTAFAPFILAGGPGKSWAAGYYGQTSTGVSLANSYVDCQDWFRIKF